MKKRPVCVVRFVPALIVLCALVYSVFSATTSEIEALNELYEATNGANWIINTNWTLGDPCLNGWYGVVCSDSSVTQLNLGFNQLVGTIPNSISNLVNPIQLKKKGT
eukprot:TRINITY_DN1326_c0_g2_i1.p1 TRINITY_DN1326_c0_g2~~TRINITY_DN1326_c0_g2_i1.p1  ORF type:complete len:107 (-),score=6.65 TRINITY_DN1326_c0_g2_i1:319-639(-)